MSYVSSIELRKVRPEAIHEKGLVESVVNLFHEVVEKVPQANNISTRPTNNDQLEPIEWMRFIPNSHQWHSAIRPDTLTLFIAYKSGLTLWIVEPSGIANELFSIREHNVCSACLLATNANNENLYSSQQPLIAIAKSAGPSSIQIRSLKNDQQIIKTFPLPGIGAQSEPLSILANNTVLVCATHTFIIGFDLTKFEEKFFISDCYSSLPITLSTRWLAYVDYRLYTNHQSLGGIDGTIFEETRSYTGAVLDVARSFSRSFAKIGETVLGFGTSGISSIGSNITDKTSISQSSSGSNSTATTHNNIIQTNTVLHRTGSIKDEGLPGVVTIIDVLKFFGPTVHDEKQNWIIGHFQAHSEEIGHLQFNPSGHLLVTCDKNGHSFNVLEIQASPYRCTRTNIKHLYNLFRGDTAARVSHMTFSQDSRWLAVSTKRGTTHIYAIHPYGGPVNVRTHTKTHVVNKSTFLQRTNSVDEPKMRPYNTVQHDVHVRDPISNPTIQKNLSITNNGQSGQLIGNRSKRSNPVCVPLSSVAIIHQPIESFVSGLSAPFNIDSICVASLFGISRGYLNPEDMVAHQDYIPKACSSIFIISWHGRLVEYILDPVPDTNKYGTRVTHETPIILKVTPKAQWTLQRMMTWPEIRMAVGYAYLSQSLRVTSNNKPPSKENWPRKVDIDTHAGPHRRLWMGPQFHFKHYSEATVSICHPDSSVFTADSPQTSMNIMEADLKSLPIQVSRSNPVHVPGNHKDFAPAYIEVGSGSFQDTPSLNIYGSSVDSVKSEHEIDLKERLADAAIDIPRENANNGNTTDSLSSSADSSPIVRQSYPNHSSDHLFIDNCDADRTD